MLASNFEEQLDAVMASAIASGSVHGVEVLARRGGAVRHKVAGLADAEAGRPLETGAVYRIYSMSKVLTSTVALMLLEEGALALTDTVASFIPSFDRQWHVVEPAAAVCPKAAGIAKLDPRRAPPAESVECYDMVHGRVELRPYVKVASRAPMLVKHLTSESSGIGYEFFGPRYAIANALRERAHPTVYRSCCILGHDLTLAQFCDVIAAAGVLVCEPGTPSYGLGASVLGRVIEVVYERTRGFAKPLSAIFDELLFTPLAMSTAAFFLRDDDPRIRRMPRLYGLTADGVCVPAEEAMRPSAAVPYTNQHDHYSGPRTYESGDTGCVMSLADYARFLDFLARGGVSASGSRLLSVAGVHTLTRGRLAGIATPHPVLPEPDAHFSFGWASTSGHAPLDGDCAHSHPEVNYWSGYAQTHVRYYRSETAPTYLLIGVQVMDHANTRTLQSALHQPLQRAFVDAWRNGEDTCGQVGGAVGGAGTNEAAAPRLTSGTRAAAALLVAAAAAAVLVSARAARR